MLGITLLPLLVSLIWKAIVGPCDYASQAGLLLLSLLIPFTAPVQWSGFRLYLSLYGIWFLWGVWRFAYFDMITKNDIPGMGYLVAPLLLCAIALALFYVRKGFSKKKTL